MKQKSARFLGTFAIIATFFFAATSFAYAVQPGIDAPGTVTAGKEFDIAVYGSRIDTNFEPYDGQLETVPYFVEMESATEYDGAPIDNVFPEDMFAIHYYSVVSRQPGKLVLTASCEDQYYDAEDDFWYGTDYDSDFKIYRIVNVKGTVKFNANKGKLKASKKSKTISQKAKIGKLPTPSRHGYKFKGWYTKKSSGKKISSKTRVSFSGATKTYYAHWKKR